MTDLAEVGADVEGPGLRVVGQGEVVQGQRGVAQRLRERRALLDQDLGHVVEAGDVLAEDLAVVTHEPGDLLHGRAEVVQRGREVPALTLEHPGHLGERLVEVAHGVVVASQRAHEALELTDRPEQLVLVVGQGAAELAEVLDGLVELLPLAAEVARRGLQQVGQGALRVGAVRTQCHREVVQTRVDLVELQGDCGVGLVERGPVGQGLATGVRRGQLDEPVTDDRRRDDHRLGVGRELHVGVVVHLHDHLGARRGHRVHLAHRHAEHADVASLVQRHRARKVGGEGPLVRPTERERGQRGDREREHDHRDQDLGEEVHLSHPPAGRAGCSGCRCRTTARHPGCWRRPGRTGPSAGCSGRCCRSSSAGRRRPSSGASAPG